MKENSTKLQQEDNKYLLEIICLSDWGSVEGHITISNAYSRSLFISDLWTVSNEFPGNDTKYDGEATVMLELWRMWSSYSLLTDLLWSGVVTPDRVLSIE